MEHSAAAPTVLRVGTRGSPLAVAQTESLRSALERAAGSSVAVLTIQSAGDRSGESLASLGGTGVFASALREALLAGECDVVVHSLKDLPTDQPPGLAIAAVPQRADARDALCARDGFTIDTLPVGARVGTGSPRRAAQLRARRADLSVVDLRGNVDSRLRRVEGGELDAVILAAAGLVRLGLSAAITEYLELDGWPTAPGQGALAIETRVGEEHRAAALNHRPTRTMVTGEREVLRILEAGCSAPIGARAMIDDGMLFLSARVYRADGGESVTAAHAMYLDDSATPELDLAARVAAELLALGAADIAPLTPKEGTTA